MHMVSGLGATVTAYDFENFQLFRQTDTPVCIPMTTTRAFHSKVYDYGFSQTSNTLSRTPKRLPRKIEPNSEMNGISPNHK
jgi:hypothetical protein